MKLTDMMNHPLKELVEQCNITKVQPISDDNGNIKKFIVEYEPYDESSESSECNNKNLGRAIMTLPFLYALTVVASVDFAYVSRVF